MGQTQFRSDDTVKWKYGFGKGTYNATLGTETASWDGSTRFSAYGAITGTAGQTSFVKPAGWGHKGLCLLHQTYGTGAGNWELAWVDFSGASAVADKPLQNTYSTGAQIITLSNGSAGFKNITVSGTFSAPAWNGSYGGVVALLARETITVNSYISANGAGFRGGAPGTSPGSGQTQSGYSGESYATARNANGGGIGGDCGGCVSPNTAAQYNGGSGGRGSRGTDAASGGAGGGHAAAGTNGTSVTATSPNYNGGYAGSTGGNAGLTSMIMGGGGGGAGCWHDGGAATAGNHYGGNGGGLIILIARNIITTTGYLQANGSNGANGGDARGGSGGGAGGSVLLKCETATLGTNHVTVAAGSGGAASGNGTSGGAGGVGRIHIDYATSYSGSSNPAIDARLDTTIKPKKGGGLLYSNFL